MFWCAAYNQKYVHAYAIRVWNGFHRESIIMKTRKPNHEKIVESP